MWTRRLRPHRRYPSQSRNASAAAGASDTAAPRRSADDQSPVDAICSLSPTQDHNALLRSLLRSKDDPTHRSSALPLVRSMLLPSSLHPPDPTTHHLIFSLLSHPSVPLDPPSLPSQLAKLNAFPNAYQLTQLVTKLCRSSSPDAAWDLVFTIKNAGGPVHAPAINALLAGLGKTRQFGKMNLLFSEMKQMRVCPNVVTYGILINQLCKSRRVDDALHVFDEMCKPDSGVVPDSVVFNTLIDGLSKAGRPEDGLALLDKMNCAPNVITYNSLIDGFCRAGEIDISHKLVARMELEGIQPNVITLNTLVSGMCRNGRISSAFQLFREKRAGANAVTYSVLMGAFLHSGNVNRAMELFDEMKLEGHSPDYVTYFTLISGLCQAGRLDEACSIASAMRSKGFRLDVKGYNTLISGLCKKKKMDRAREMFEDMEEAGLRPDVFTYNTFIAAACKEGDLSTAQELLVKMDNDGCRPSVVTYGSLIHGFCLAGNLDEAMKIFRSMTGPNQPNTVIYNIIIDFLCKNKEVDIAISLMDEMSYKGVSPNVITYNSIFKGLYEKNMSSRAFELMDQMKEQGCDPNYVTMEILTEWLPAIGEVERLRNFLQKDVSESDTASSAL